MPNYSKLEQELLTPEQRSLLVNSRSPAIGKLDDSGLQDLMADLETAMGQAGQRRARIARTRPPVIARTGAPWGSSTHAEA